MHCETIINEIKTIVNSNTMCNPDELFDLIEQLRVMEEEKQCMDE